MPVISYFVTRVSPFLTSLTSTPTTFPLRITGTTTVSAGRLKKPKMFLISSELSTSGWLG